MVKTILGLLLCAVSFTTSAQTLVYKVPDGRILSSIDYFDYKVRKITNDSLDTVLNTVERNDSIIREVMYYDLNTMDNAESYMQYFGVHYKNIGKQFPLQQAAAYNPTLKYGSLKGKPTLINFYFKDCAPCIKEVPFLNELKNAMGDRVNFIAITPDDKRAVAWFEKKYDFKFDKIMDARALASGLGVRGYPLNLLLSKNEVLTQVYSSIQDARPVQIDLEDLLQEPVKK